MQETQDLISTVLSETKTKFTLRAIWGKQQGPLVLYPCRDGITGKIKGAKVLSPQEKLTCKRVVDENTNRTIRDGLEIDLQNEVDTIDWDWMKECKEIALGLDDAQESVHALFYVEDLDREVVERVTQNDLRFKAQKYVKESPDFRKAEICRLLGRDAKYMRPIDIYDYLMDEAIKHPTVIINAYEDKNYKTKLFLYTLIDRKILYKDINGFYKYNDITLGVNEESTIQWMRNDNNKDLMRQFHLLLNPDWSESTGDKPKKETISKLVPEPNLSENVDQKIVEEFTLPENNEDPSPKTEESFPPRRRGRQPR